MNDADPTDPRVLLVGTFLPSGHSRSVGQDLAERLRDRGWSVLMTSSATGRIGRLAGMALTTWSKRHRYDVAHIDVFGGRAFVLAEIVAFLLRRAETPYVLTLHGGNLPATAKRSPRRMAALLQSAAVVTTPSGFLQEAMEPYRGDLVRMPNPVDVDRFAFRARPRPAPRIIWVRAFHQIYRPELAPEALHHLRAQVPDATLVMVGPDKDGSLERTRTRARELGVDGAVEFTGGVPHDTIPEWLDRADVFLNTTDVDNTPVSVLEAMAAGLPVVSTRVGGIPHLLDDGADALLVPPGDARAMAAAIGRILKEPGLAQRLTTAGRSKVEGMSWTAMVRRWESLFRAVARGEPWA